MKPCVQCGKPVSILTRNLETGLCLRCSFGNAFKRVRALLTCDPASNVPAGVKWVYNITLIALVLLAVAITAVGSYAATIWLTKRGVGNEDAIKILFLVPIIGLYMLVALGKAALDRVVSRRFRQRQEAAPRTEERFAESGQGGGNGQHRPVRKTIAGVLLAALMVASGFAVWYELLPAFSYETRKTRMEAAVGKKLEQEGLEFPLKPEVELTEQQNGVWSGTARFGDAVYRVEAERSGGLLSVQWRRSK